MHENTQNTPTSNDGKPHAMQPARTTRLRRVGNSIGVTFLRDDLAVAGFQEGQSLEIEVVAGEIRLRAVPEAVVVSFSIEEAAALAAGHVQTGPGAAAREKLLLAGCLPPVGE